MRLRSLAVFAVLPMLASAARADTVRTFDLFAEGPYPTIVGTVGLDENTGKFVSGDFHIYGGVYDAAITTPPESQITDAADGVTVVTYHYQYLTPGSTFEQGSGYYVDFLMTLPTADTRGYNGGPLCSYALLCGGIYPVSASQFTSYTYGPMDDNPPYFENDSLQSASLTPAAATPEPSSLLLLATGLCGVLLVVRRGSKVSDPAAPRNA